MLYQLYSLCAPHNGMKSHCLVCDAKAWVALEALALLAAWAAEA